MLCYGFNCFCENCQAERDDVAARPACKLVVGEQYLMSIAGAEGFRVLLLTPDAFDETTKERRAHVVVLEDNPFVKTGAECRPLAGTLGPLP